MRTATGELRMVRLKGIERLPPAEQAKIYAEIAQHLKALADQTHGDGIRMMFLEMANDIDGRRTML
jgi:hypothetical protein